MICDGCDKGYHTFCLNPPLNRPPQGWCICLYFINMLIGGWRCPACVQCVHCGARTPGLGASCKWRANYTACDSCYQLLLDKKVWYLRLQTILTLLEKISIALFVYVFIEQLTKHPWSNVMNVTVGFTFSATTLTRILMLGWLKVSVISEKFELARLTGRKCEIVIVTS